MLVPLSFKNLTLNSYKPLKMKEIRKYQVLFDGGEIAELVGFYSGANKATGIPIFKIRDKFYLGQNPSTGSMFGSFARRGYPLYWELSEYPDRTVGLKYTGKIVFMFRLISTVSAKNYIISVMKKERQHLKAVNKRPVMVEV